VDECKPLPGGYSMKRRSLHTCVKPSPDGRYASTCSSGGAPAARSQRLRGKDTLVARPSGESKRHTYAYEYENDRVNQPHVRDFEFSSGTDASCALALWLAIASLQTRERTLLASSSERRKRLCAYMFCDASVTAVEGHATPSRAVCSIV
jgi:hypothetical protein